MYLRDGLHTHILALGQKILHRPRIGTGYDAMLCVNRAETSKGRLENAQELIQLAGSFHSPRELLDHAALAITGQDGLPAVARPTTTRAAMMRAQTGQQRLSQRSYLYPSSQSRKVLTLRRMRRMRPNKRIFIQAPFLAAMVV